MIMLTDQADVSAAYQMKDQDTRGWFVYNTLTQHAARTQAGLRSELEARGVSYQSFWAANMIVADADRAFVESLAARSDVARIDSNNPVRWIEEPEVAKAGVKPAAPDGPNAIEWGVTNVNAPSVWGAGFTGAGIVVGNLDTGTRWTHNALKPKYRGWNGATADHNYNWHDAIHSGGGSCGPNTAAPCDDNGHGTHTAGTMVGDDGVANQIGVAPGAKWIGCRNMDQGIGTPATYTECFQFMIAPTDLSGNNPNPALRPHVLNNSWDCTASEGCTTRSELETIVNNTQAAGIFVDVSAGNTGPACSTVTAPPAIYTASFTVGAYDINNTLASFSSRGPSTYYTPNLLKPNLVAPGVNVRSSFNSGDTTYGNLSGTSMSVPHVAGVVALLWSARPHLVREIAATKTVLQNTANPAVTLNPVQTCGNTPSSQVPNNSFGHGRVDALAAVNAAVPGLVANVSTRLAVGTGDDVLIEGFIVQGPAGSTKKIMVRAIGPSLLAFGIQDALGNPTLEIHDGSNAVVATNNDWRITQPGGIIAGDQSAEINTSGLAPGNDLESAIIASLTPGSYTAVMRGVGNTVGTGVVDAYDMSAASTARLANIATRGLIQPGEKLMIGGFIVQNSSVRIVVRAIGPSLAAFGITNALPDTTLQLRDQNGVVVRENDDWMTTQKAELEATGLQPTHNLEAALVQTIPPGQYTAQVRGKPEATGTGVVQVYFLQ